jgi:integrase
MLNHCKQSGTCLIWEASQHLRKSHQVVLAGIGGCITIASAIEELIAAKAAANRRERYTKSLRYYLEQFAAGREQAPLASFTFADVESWMQKFPSAWTRQTWLNRLSTLFSFAVRRGHISANPCDRVERVTADRCPPKILSPAQADLLLSIVPMMCRPYLILGLFAGIRPEETMRLDWSAVNLETKTVRVEGKTRRRRIVPLEPRAVALLAGCPLQRGPVSPSHSTVRRFKERARGNLGLARWPQDVLRHTAASYLLALHKDAGKVATTLGNSSAVLLSHYHEPVTDGDCALFWSVAGMTKYDRGTLDMTGQGS